MTKTKHEFDFDFTKLKEVSVAEIIPNNYNPKDKDTKEYKQVRRSIENNGLRQPIIVREHDGYYEIIDGEQRFTAAKELGYTKVYVYNEGRLDDKQAKALTIWYEVQVPFNEIDLSHIVVELADMDMELPYSEAQIQDFRHMAEFDFNDYDKGNPEDSGAPEMQTYMVKITPEQLEILKQAIDRVVEDYGYSEGKALEMIAGDFLSGYQSPTPKE